jgi:hypothetical protein
MASSPRSEREEERRHNIRTLVIASAASATAAAVTSQLWIRGTWIAAAITPVMVALVSELLNRPAERIARVWTAERPALPDDAGPRPAARPEPPPRTAPPAAGREPPVKIYRTQPASGRPSRRKLAIGTILATAGLAFVIAVVTITAVELIAGESIGKGDRRTTFAGGSTKQKDTKDADERQGETTEERPAETEQETPAEQPTETETTPTDTTETTPAPTQETAPAPAPQVETAPAP